MVLGTIGAAAALGVGFTFLWHAGLLGDEVAPVDFGQGAGGVRWSTLLVLVLLVPIVSELLKQVGPLFLSSRPQFDDMIDGLTFGVAAGASFAAAETIVVNRSLFSSFGSIDSPDAGFWVSLILSAAIVKPIVYGAATGIAVAAWSGLGRGFDGFKPAYLRGLGEALLANILFQAGLYLASRVEGTAGAVLGLVWGALIGAVLIVRLRYLLHFAVLEAALESAEHRLVAQGRGARDGVLPLVRDAAAGGRELLRGLWHRHPGRQQGHPQPQPHRRRRSTSPRPSGRSRSVRLPGTTPRPQPWSAPWWRRSCSVVRSAREWPPRERTTAR